MPAVTPLAAGAVDCQVVPLLVSTFPAVLGATNEGVDVPLPNMTLLAVSVERPVPPLAIGNVPVTPVVKGNPVAFVNVPLVGVPNIGVTSVGLVDNTVLPEPVEVVTPVPPLATGNVPVTPVDKGKPVKLVAVPPEGVPNAPPFTTGAPAVPTLTAKAVATPVPSPETPVEIGRPVALVKVALVGVPNIGVTNVGLVDNTVLPVPVEVVTPVPPLATGNAVPDKVIANVPLVVIGEPATDKNVGTVAATLVTVPLPLAVEFMV